TALHVLFNRARPGACAAIAAVAIPTARANAAIARPGRFEPLQYGSVRMLPTSLSDVNPWLMNRLRRCRHKSLPDCARVVQDQDILGQWIPPLSDKSYPIFVHRSKSRDSLKHLFRCFFH